MTRSSKPTHIPALDGIRGLAALMIMVYHFAPVGGAIKLRVLESGVDLFFVLSGFLITRILIASRQSPAYFRSFYARRALRIFPLYYGALIVYLFVLPMLAGQAPVPRAAQWWYWTYLENVPPTLGHTIGGPGHFWSLAVEEHFYLLWPLLVWLLPVKRLKIAAIGIIAAVIALRAVLVVMQFKVYYFTLTRMDLLAAGALLACVEAELGSLACRRNVFRCAVIGTIVIALAAYFTLPATLLENANISYTFFGVLYFFIVALAAASDSHDREIKPLVRGYLPATGMISYGLYVLHPLAFVLVAKVLAHQHWSIRFLAAFGASYALAAASYFCFERPILKLKAYFQPDSSAPPIRLSVPAMLVGEAQAS